MTTTRRYLWEYPRIWGSHDQVLEVLQEACERHWWYQDPEVGGRQFTRLWFAFTVSGRDQWWAHRRAMKLAVDCFWAAGLDAGQIPVPDWETLPPHTNRGHQREPVASNGG